MEVTTTSIKSFGGVSMQLYFFDKNARAAFRKKYPSEEIDGIKIYRDGIITTPFAEREEESDKKRDILGIDKRLWQDLFNKVGTREMIGIVNITKDDNPKIIDATNRQDFTDTPEYRDLKEFIMLQVEAFDAYKVFLRTKKKSPAVEKMDDAGKALSDLSKILDQTIQHSSPQVAVELEPLRESVGLVAKNIEKAMKAQSDEESERARHESMYLRIMSRQEDAINITHAVKTSMGKIHRQAGFFKDRFPNEELNEYFELYAKQIFYEMTQLDRATDELFDYSKTNLPFTDINMKQLIEYLLNSYQERFAEEGISLEMQIEDNLVLNCNEMFFYDVVQNITDNAIKAMKESKTKIYRCTMKALRDKLVIDFSDTGCGIPIEKREWVFGIYNTTTADQGGGGIGLYAVRLRVSALRGSVRVIDSEFAPLGTTIHIELPFKR
jgi:signal transduction histidine kinase